MKVKTSHRFGLPLLGLTVLGAASIWTLTETQAKTQAPADLVTQLNRDSSPLADNGQLRMSYADVVEKILPSVVTIFPSSPVGGAMDHGDMDMDQIPPQLRPFFYRYFGIPEESDPFEDGDRPQRRNPRQDLPRQRGVGSGVLITADGFILTNNHVIADADDIEVAVEDNGDTRSYKAEVIGTDPLTDVALIKIDAKGLVPATIGDSSLLRVGDVVLAAGAPMELNLSVTQGIVSALGRSGMGVVRDGAMAGYEDFIQTDAAINPGNSGGPLVDGMGRVIGINTAILSRTGMNGGIGFAIPVNMALAVVEDLLDDGVVSRGFLGVQITDLDLEKADLLGLKNQGGALVTMVGGESPADKAGIEVGDVIVGAGDDKVDSSARLRLLISARKPGTAVPLAVVRDGERMTVTAMLEELPTEATLASGGGIPRSSPPAAATAEIVPGLTARSLNPELREEFGIPADINGVVVVEVDPESRAASMGIEAGDVIQQVNQKPVTKLDEAKTLAQESKRTALLRIYRDGDTMLVMVNVD